MRKVIWSGTTRKKETRVLLVVDSTNGVQLECEVLMRDGWQVPKWVGFQRDVYSQALLASLDVAELLLDEAGRTNKRRAKQAIGRTIRHEVKS